MDLVRFSNADGWLLWSIPRDGCDLEYLMRAYAFIARDAIPRFDQVRQCLSRAARAGILLPPNSGRFELDAKWERQFRMIVGRHSVPEDGIEELDELLRSGDWPQVAADFVLAEDDYRRAAGRVERYYEGAFGRESQ